MNEALIPVILTVGEVKDRPHDLAAGLEPLALMKVALDQALEHIHHPEIKAWIDAIAIVNFVSWRYQDPTQQLCQILNIQPKQATYGELGGESPIRFLHQAALAIARGESRVAVVFGAEARNTALKARRQHQSLAWTPYAKTAQRPVRAEDFLDPATVALGLGQPISVYPLFESAMTDFWQQNQAQALTESGQIWQKFSDIASHNPTAWADCSMSASQITTPSPKNPLIAWPYTKYMVANPTVNQGSAIVLTNLETAKQLGIAPQQLGYIWGGAHAREPRDFMRRRNFYECPAQEIVLQQLQKIAGDPVDHVELYSCFPCVPKLARRQLNLSADHPLSVAGGLTFFGAPLNNYMSHATCAMFRQLTQSQDEQVGLLYGQGEFMTKHHGMIIANHPPATSILAWSDQAYEPTQHDDAPLFSAVFAEGMATLEAFTILYHEDHSISHAAVVIHQDHKRGLAKVPPEDQHTLSTLMDLNHSPIGLSGNVFRAQNLEQRWQIIAN
jgi:acetyl-CoA C-acetyltransferase